MSKSRRELRHRHTKGGGPTQARTYRVIATRTTVYEVAATSQEDACDQMTDGQAEEVDQVTTEISATPLCPDCHSTLDNRLHHAEANYCPECDREVQHAE